MLNPSFYQLQGEQPVHCSAVSAPAQDLSDATRLCIYNTGLPGNTTHVLGRVHKSKGCKHVHKTILSVNILVSAMKNVKRILNIKLCMYKKMRRSLLHAP